MSLRRYAPMKPSRGTVWPTEVVEAAYRIHRGCLGAKVGMPGDCAGQLEPDHIRASGAIGKKSRSTLDNCAPLCGVHHRLKTREGRTWRPLLIDAVDKALSGDCGHVEPMFGCPGACNRADPMQMPETA